MTKYYKRWNTCTSWQVSIYTFFSFLLFVTFTRFCVHNFNENRMLTTPVIVHKCLKSIKGHAFVKSPYPLVIILEDHLMPSLQAKVAEMVTNTFGEMLYFPQPSDKDEFPSPAALRHQIILSTKPPKEYLQSKNLVQERSSMVKIHLKKSRSWGTIKGLTRRQEIMHMRSLSLDS